MCGLVGVFSKRNKNAGQYAFELYSKQKSRGQRGFGYVAIKDGYVIGLGRAMSELGIKGPLMKENADAILFHHRFPTSTDNTLGTTHPIFVSNDILEYDYYVAHNGIVTNTIELKKKHNELGYVYTTEHDIREVATYKDGTSEILSDNVTKFNDSECLAIEIARYVEDLVDEIGITGSAAFWAVQVVKGTGKVNNIYLGKNYGRDLCEVNTGKWYSFSSETGEDLEPLKLYTMDISDLSMTEQELKIRDTAEPAPAPVVYHNYGYHQSYTPRYKDILLAENKRYTYEQVRYSGFDFTDFVSVWDKNSTYYIPRQYASEPNVQSAYTQPLLPTNSDSVEAEQNYSDIVKDVISKEEKEKLRLRFPLKDIERLEELSIEYAIAEDEIDNLEDLLEDGSIDQTEYTTQWERLQADIQLSTERMSLLGLPQELVEDAIAEACSMKAYNYK